MRLSPLEKLVWNMSFITGIRSSGQSVRNVLNASSYACEFFWLLSFGDVLIKIPPVKFYWYDISIFMLLFWYYLNIYTTSMFISNIILFLSIVIKYITYHCLKIYVMMPKILFFAKNNFANAFLSYFTPKKINSIAPK